TISINYTNSQVPFKLTQDPINPQVSYLLKFNGQDDEAKRVIAGPYWRGVSLLRVDEAGSEQVLVKDLPFITRARWSADGRYLGLMGADKLFLWEPATGKITLVNQVVNTPSVTHFGFGPGNKIYTEHANLPNDVIFDPVSRQGHPAYEIQGRPLYYKEDLGDGLYAGTVVKDGDKTSVGEVMTVIADANGKILSRVVPGRYRDHQGKALLNVGAERFGLYYIADYNRPQAREIYSGFVYQAAIVADGAVVYTRPGAGDKPYLLCRYDPRTMIKMEQAVSGPFFAVSPDGQMIFGGGWQEEQIRAVNLQLNAQARSQKPAYAEVRQALLGAGMAYNRFYCQPVADSKTRQQELARWYVDTKIPVTQSALFDITEELSARGKYATSYYGDYLLSGNISQIEVKSDQASVVTNLGVSTSSGSGWGYEAAYEMIKTGDGWKVTGLSTFPKSGERHRIESVVNQFIAKAERGEMVNFNLQDSPRVYQEVRQKPLQMGQIQFWRMSEPHKSPNVETANHAKVYLESGGKTYNLLLEKKGYAWRITGLTDHHQGGLF
ncbi:MAG: hypothetical protein ACM3O9_08060, partial [Methylocystaceae bacterium]